MDKFKKRFKEDPVFALTVIAIAAECHREERGSFCVRLPRLQDAVNRHPSRRSYLIQILSLCRANYTPYGETAEILHSLWKHHSFGESGFAYPQVGFLFLDLAGITHPMMKPTYPERNTAMFKKHKLEVRIVKDDARTNSAAPVQETTPDYVGIADEATRRIGAKLLIGAAALLVTTAVVAVLANAADTALQNALTHE